jgi:signal transduction histidine kinase
VCGKKTHAIDQLIDTAIMNSHFPANESTLFDENARRQLAEASLRSITLSTSRVTGEEFFRVLVRDLAQALDMHYVIAGELCTQEGEEFNRTIAVWAGNDYMANMSYSLSNTPCSNVADQSMCFHACDIQQAYPLDTLLVDMQAESYVGMPMVGTDGKTLGILVALDTKAIDENRRLLSLSLLSIFAARCAAELQHQRREAQLEELVAQRTQALENTQKLLMQKEKLAALGSLVAGVAHAINTPLGNAIMTVSSFQHFVHDMQQHLNSEKVSKQHLLSNLDQLAQGTQLAEQNLARASDLISNFRTLAETELFEMTHSISLQDAIDAAMYTHKDELKHKQVSLQLTLPDQLQVRLAQGALTHIIDGIFHNALIHGFVADTQDAQIHLRAQVVNGTDLELQIKDNGIGASAEICQHIFEPFFTTRLGQGSSGLGMHVVYTLVQRLNGEIQVSSTPNQGLCVSMLFRNCVDTI